MRRHPFFLATAALCLLFAACSEPSGTGEPAGLALDLADDAQLRIGSQQQLKAFYVDADGRRLGPATAEWTVSDNRVATIDAQGNLRLASSYIACDWVEPGQCRVEVVARAGTFETRKQITIMPFMPVVETSVSLVDVEIGYPQQLRTNLTLELQPVSWCQVSYRSVDPLVATVDAETGIINGIDVGTTYVDVDITGPLCPDGPQVPVISRAPFHVLAIEPDLPTELAVGESLQLTAFITNWKDVTYAAPFVEWSSSDSALVTVENGLVRAAHCTSADGCTVTVTARTGRLRATATIHVR